MGSLYGEDMIRAVKAYDGYHEGSNNWTIFSKILDECNYYAPQKKQNQPWCATYINFSALQAAIPEDRDNEAKRYDAQYFLFQPSYNNLSCSVKFMAQYFKDAGAWYEEPELADVVFFNQIDENGNIIDYDVHVGLVTDLGKYITTEEGNAGDMVQEKYYDFSDIGVKIHGFGRPRYDGFKNPANISHEPVEDKPEEPTTEFDVGTVKVSDFLAIRKGPGVEHEKVGELYDGATVTIIEKYSNWARIGSGIWVCSDYLK